MVEKKSTKKIIDENGIPPQDTYPAYQTGHNILIYFKILILETGASSEINNLAYN